MSQKKCIPMPTRPSERRTSETAQATATKSQQTLIWLRALNLLVRTLLVALVGAVVSSHTSSLLWADDIYLTNGGRQNIFFNMGQTIRVKGPKIFQIENRGNSIQITGLQKGSASIHIGAKNYQIYVVDKSQINFLKALQNKLKDFLGLSAELKNGDIIITGHLYRLTDWQAIFALAKEFNASYFMQAQFEPEIEAPARAWIKQLIFKKGLPEPGLDFENEAVAYIAEDQRKWADHWEQILGPLGVARKYEKAQVAIEPLVRVRIIVAEVNKKLQTQMGIEWPEMASASLVPRFNGPSTLEVFLKAMEQKGLGQILASPNLLARSGSEADFLAGGEFAIKVITSRSREVVWKKHGIFLKIKPLADRLKRLSIELTTEVSLIDMAQSVDGIPALKTNRMTTHFDLTHARTIVLSGLIRSDWGKSTSGIAGLSKVPVLGALFKSEDFHNNKTELVVFVTPEIVNDNEDVGRSENLMPHGWTNHD